MDSRPTLFLDSGIGGIPYCRHFYLRNPAETIVYLADRLHFPYGTRQGRELILILSELMEKITRIVDPKIAVIACNTATVSALEDMRGRFPGIPFVGTVPAIKPAVSASKTKKVGVLGTERTIDAPYIGKLAAQFGPCEICGIAAPELVEFVENRFDTADETEKREIALSYIKRFRALNADVIVLGCTHFLFLLDEFRQEAAPDILVFDSVDGITRRVESLLDNSGGKMRAPEGNAGINRVLLTGSAAPNSAWQDRARAMGFELALLEEA